VLVFVFTVGALLFASPRYVAETCGCRSPPDSVTVIEQWDVVVELDERVHDAVERFAVPVETVKVTDPDGW